MPSNTIASYLQMEKLWMQQDNCTLLYSALPTAFSGTDTCDLTLSQSRYSCNQPKMVSQCLLTRSSKVKRNEPVSNIQICVQKRDSCKSEISESARYKTEMCRPFEETGQCRYGMKCQFAHGLRELRNMNRHPRYKTEFCRTFHTIGFCSYGQRCNFIHNEEERRSPDSKPQRPSSLHLQFISTGDSPTSSVSGDSPSCFASDDVFTSCSSPNFDGEQSPPNSPSRVLNLPQMQQWFNMLSM